MASRNDLWFDILERGLEGVVPLTAREKVPYAWQLDALMNGLVLQAITTEAAVSFEDIEEVVVAAALEHGRALLNGKVARRAGSSSRRRAGAKPA
jgi:hypothetical protein